MADLTRRSGTCGAAVPASAPLHRLALLALELHRLTLEVQNMPAGTRTSLDVKIERVAARFDRAHAKALAERWSPDTVFLTRDAAGKSVSFSLQPDGLKLDVA